ncbi:unnamed protein product [Caenorhabditis nigoni]
MTHILGFRNQCCPSEEAGARTPAHQENLCVASINWNYGPGECIWYMVPLAFALKQLYQYHSNWWPCEKDLKDHGFVAIGSYHRVQAIGPCVNVSWNIASYDALQRPHCHAKLQP